MWAFVIVFLGGVFTPTFSDKTEFEVKEEKMSETIQFNQILEMIDYLSVDEQDDLINIIQHRQIEKRREEIANNINQSRKDYQEGNVFRGTVDDIIAELNDD